MVATSGRRSVVTPGVRRLRRSYAVHLVVGCHGRGRLVWCRGYSIYDWRGLGGQPGSDHSGGASVVGHGWGQMVYPRLRSDRGRFIVFAVEWLAR